jgi:hypothetical protein
MRTTTSPFRRATMTFADAAGACFATFASASETTKYAAASIRGGSR